MYERENTAVFDVEWPEYPIACFEDSRTAALMAEWANRMSREGLDDETIRSSLWVEAQHV